MSRRAAFLISALWCAALAAQQPQAPTTNLGNDANGNPRRLAVKTGHVSNYDETKVPPFTLPDPLVLANGKWVRDAEAWRRERRPEIIRLYEAEIFGRVPASAPKVTWFLVFLDKYFK
jgi:hypothetical protein